MLAMARYGDAERRRMSLKMRLRECAMCMKRGLNAGGGSQTQAAMHTMRKARERSNADWFLPLPTHNHTSNLTREWKQLLARKETEPHLRNYRVA